MVYFEDLSKQIKLSEARSAALEKKTQADEAEEGKRKANRPAEYKKRINWLEGFVPDFLEEINKRSLDGKSEVKGWQVRKDKHLDSKRFSSEDHEVTTWDHGVVVSFAALIVKNKGTINVFILQESDEPFGKADEGVYVSTGSNFCPNEAKLVEFFDSGNEPRPINKIQKDLMEKVSEQLLGLYKI